MNYIYMIENTLNGHKYIGKTVMRISDRWRAHKNTALDNKVNFPLYVAMRKYGLDNFTIKVIEEIEDEQLLAAREVYWIQYYNTYYENSGYNATLGGEGACKYNHKEIEELIKNGKTYNEIKELVGCCSDLIRQIASRNGLSVCYDKINRPIAQYTKTGEFVQNFNTRTEAAEWLIHNNHSKSKDIDAVLKTLSKALTGKSKSSSGFVWKQI